MKRLLLATITLLASTSPVLAASVTIQVNTNAGKPMASLPLVCTTTKPKQSNGMPTPPVFGNLTTNGSGVATWAPETGDNYSQMCRVAYAITPDSCYSFPSTTGSFTLGSGDSKSFTITASYLTDTCGVKVPQSEAEALTNPYGTQKIDPMFGDKPVSTSTPKPNISPSPSPTLTPSTESPAPEINTPKQEIVTSIPQQIISNIQSFFARFLNIFRRSS